MNFRHDPVTGAGLSYIDAMTPFAPFRVLSHAEFSALGRTDKLAYLARAMEAHKVLAAQIEQGAAPALRVEVLHSDPAVAAAA